MYVGIYVCQVYRSEINKIMERPTCYYIWESEYFYATFDWDLINVIPYECTTETFLQSILEEVHLSGRSTLS